MPGSATGGRLDEANGDDAGTGRATDPGDAGTVVSTGFAVCSEEGGEGESSDGFLGGALDWD
jgi:hypothetical protein